LSPSDFTEYVQLLSGNRLDPAGVLRILSPAEQGHLHQSFRTRHPEFFSASREMLQGWHQKQISESSNLRSIEASIFHLQCALKLNSSNQALSEQITRFESCRVPPRQREAPERSLDLSLSYTDSLDSFLDEGFQKIPRGLQSFDGTLFDIRGQIRFPAKVQQIAGSRFSIPLQPISVGQRCSKLHLLHAARDGSAPEGAEVVRWIVHYIDGSQRVWPIQYGIHLRDWTSNREVTLATAAWTGTVTLTNGSSSPRNLFKTTWNNPASELEITHLEFAPGTDLRPQTSVPFVVAITLE
jgi:hypothetical protein